MSPPVADEGAIPQAVPDDETQAVSDGTSQFQGIARPARPTLKVLTGSQAGLTHVMAGEQTVVGRGAQCDLQIEDASLSRRHCRLLRRGGGFFIEDLESRNGTRVDGERISAVRPIYDGALIELAAGMTLKFSVKDDLELEAEQRLYQSAVLDPLTGLHNRRHLDERLRAELAYASRHDSPLSLLVLDIDHFKKINDTLGHAAGDAALRGLGERLHRSVRTEDVVARFGGEEFAVIARGIMAAGALLLAERMRETIAKLRIPFEATTISFTVSIGIVTRDAKRPFDNVDELFKAADAALYKAKQSGRNRCVQG